MSLNRDFLHHILPREGVYCGVTIRKGRTAQVFSDNIDQLLALLTTEDAKGGNVYHACASFNGRGSRKAIDVCAVRALWLDVDAGVSKPYQDQHDVASAVATFCRQLSLPTPTYVGSGNGLHVYWPLTQDLSLDQWLPYARGLKAACVRHGLMAGPERTADAASILRPVGSHHRKAEEREVVSGPLKGPYPLSLFGSLREGSGEVSPRHTTLAASSTHRSSAVRSLAAAVQNIYVDEPSDPDLIADRCAQIGAMRATGGRLPYPLWFAAIGVLSRATDGEDVCHEWSQGYDGYSEFEVDRKIEEVKRIEAPPTCRHFSDLNPDGCMGCPLAGKISTPLQSGRQPRTPSPSAFTATLPPNPFSSPPATTGLPPGVALPTDFTFSNGSLVAIQEGSDGTSEHLIVCGQELYLESIQSGELSHGRTAYRFKHHLPRAGWRTVEIPAETAHGQAGLAKLAGMNIVIAQPDHFRRFLAASTTKYHQENDMAQLYEQCGWKNDDTAFLVGRTLYTATGNEPVSANAEITRRAEKLQPKARGSLTEWSRTANKLFAAGAEAQAFTLLAGFAAPLMHFFATGEGGAILSLVSTGTAKGKTTALAGFASIWGDDKGLDLINGDTIVARGTTLSTLCHLPVVFDEAQAQDPDKLRDFIETFTVGRERMRGAVDGSILRTAGSWSTVMLTTSNTSLFDAIQSRPGSDAMAWRIFELRPTLAEGIRLEGDQLKNDLWKNSGHAGPVFLKALLEPANLAWVKAALPTVLQQVADKAQLESAHRYWARLLAAVAVAGVILNQLDLLSFSPQRITAWAIEQAKANKIMGRTAEPAGTQDPVTGQHKVGALATAVATYLNDHISHMLIMPRAFARSDMTNAPLFEPVNRMIGRQDRDTGLISLAEKPLREWLAKNAIGFREMMDVLRGDGVLIDRKAVTIGAGSKFTSGQVPCVLLDGGHPAFTGVLREVPTREKRRA